ncbi:hypothetical protein K457DRAFT_13621 [Linnemannia elongata AG-77]|uniref:Uncharacterized protein n=1 Tax=Linnemannia elongata AG-77 TaxID=1314771 RepID=A0A197KBG3_9FUNG|nr:hypothetical protein K457DRAFT_13621 [Linnemannia elongata AG-77]
MTPICRVSAESAPRRMVINRFITFSADPLIKDTLLFELDKFYRSQIAKIKTKINNIFTNESTPFTLNKYNNDDIRRSRKATAEKQILQLVKIMHTQLTSTGEQVKQLYSNICNHSATLHRHLINSVHLYFEILFIVDDNTISRLIEAQAKQARLKELDNKVDVLSRSLLEL